MENIYLIGFQDKKAFKKNGIPLETEVLPIDEMRFDVLGKDITTYCFDKITYLEHGDIIVFNKYYYKGEYHSSYIGLMEYMIQHKVVEMDIHLVSFIMVNNKETEEVLYTYNAVPGIIELNNIEKQDYQDIEFETIFVPRQKKSFIFQKRLCLKEIKNLYAKKNKACPYDSMYYVFNKILDDDESCHIVSYDVIRDFCQKSERFVFNY